MTVEQNMLSIMNGFAVFSNRQYYDELVKNGYQKTYGTFRECFRRMVNAGIVLRVGRNAYCISDNTRTHYRHGYSDLASQVSERIKEHYPYLDYVIFETVQLNEFINHQIGRNTIFVFVEGDVIDFVFDGLKDIYPGKVMMTPSSTVFHQYRGEDTIVLMKLVSEAPKNQPDPWRESLEKLLVDVMAEQLIQETFSESEMANIYETAFKYYIIDESKMFRYARRRNIAEKVRTFIKDNTDVKLKTEGTK